MEAVIFAGIQATGKSTFYQQHFFKTHVRINLDMLKTRHREAILLRACLEAQQRFVVDNTNLTVEDRALYIQLAKAAQFRVAGYYFQSIVKEAMQRNNMRTGKEKVPVPGLLSAHKRLQIPTLEEGFDGLYYVKIVDGQFIVEEWTREV
ncbi:MAG: AAA family ATPase [Chloroflexota bacterium]